MRKITLINNNWYFSKDNITFQEINLPHTWNNIDGQDGGGDYLRQTCYYKKDIYLAKTGKKVFLEFQGVNHIAKVSFNGEFLTEHKGGFSTFRTDITKLVIAGKNTIEVSVDNSEEIDVYPQKADFTFFGGIYRDVNLIEVDQTHFDLEYYGSSGIYITPEDSKVSVLAYVKGATPETSIIFDTYDQNNILVASTKADTANEVKASFIIQNPILWDGMHNPHLYTLKAKIVNGEEILDNLAIQFGVRSYSVCPEKGFILNGKELTLRGVSRHQDKYNKGWAVSKEDQERDIDIIKEVGANTIRLAHYQHDQHFYNLCDQEGFVIWAEIPFITAFINTQDAIDNTISQMKELVLQNYNHPSICFWGISNEITISGESPELEDNQRKLVEIVKSFDKTRLTTLANVTFTPIESNQNSLTDIVAYNHYFGWYGGLLTDNENWIDDFHAKYPKIAIGISEYGAEGILGLHSETPECKDYTEEYHALYHEHMLKIFEERPFIWGTYQWNMFDFAADFRDEGGIQGRNNKGLVTFDREIKKDAFYLYKAYWNKTEKFVHITGRRFVDRHSEQTTIKVYSNEDKVTLIVNGTEVASLTSEKIFIFENIELQPGANTILAVADNSRDEINLNKVDTPNQSYVLPKEESSNEEGVKNWFAELQKDGTTTMTFDPEYFSIQDVIKDILKNDEAKEFLMGMLAASGAKPNKGMMKMAEGMKMEMLLKMAGNKMPPGTTALINGRLQKIKK